MCFSRIGSPGTERAPERGGCIDPWRRRGRGDSGSGRNAEHAAVPPSRQPGTRARTLTRLQAEADAKGLITWEVNVDSTVRRT
jgi:hypothetical protein